MTARVSTAASLPPRLELRDGDRLVGLIDGDIVRFRGFGTESGAARAAAIAHQAMLRRLARGNRGTTSETEANLSTVRRTTDHANATTNGRPVGRVLRFLAESMDGDDTGDFAFEVRVPAPIDEVRMRGMAYVMYRALRSSGVAWPLFRPATAPEIPAATAIRRVAERSVSNDGIAARALRAIKRHFGGSSGPWAPPWPRPQRLGGA